MPNGLHYHDVDRFLLKHDASPTAIGLFPLQLFLLLSIDASLHKSYARTRLHCGGRVDDTAPRRLHVATNRTSEEICLRAFEAFQTQLEMCMGTALERKQEYLSCSLFLDGPDEQNKRPVLS